MRTIFKVGVLFLATSLWAGVVAQADEGDIPSSSQKENMKKALDSILGDQNSAPQTSQQEESVSTDTQESTAPADVGQNQPPAQRDNAKKALESILDNQNPVPQTIRQKKAVSASPQESDTRVKEVGRHPAQAGDVVWLEARALCHRADSLPEDEAGPVYEQAYQKAREAVEVEPQSAAAHYYLGLSAAKLARLAGAFSKLKYIHETESEMQKVIHLDPRFSDAGAYRILGKIDFEMPGALGGSNKRARAYLLKAVALAPDNVLNHLYLAEVLKALGDRKGARAEAFRVTVMPPDAGMSRDDNPRDRAQKLLDSLPD